MGEKKKSPLGRTELPCRGQNQHRMTSQDELTRFPRRLSAAKDKLSYLNHSNNQSSQLSGSIDDFHIDKSHYITHKYINERVFSQCNYSHLIIFFCPSQAYIDKESCCQLAAILLFYISKKALWGQSSCRITRFIFAVNAYILH